MTSAATNQAHRSVASQECNTAPSQEKKTSHMQTIAALVATTAIAALIITLSFLFAPVIPAIIVTAIISLAALSTIEGIFLKSIPQENTGCSTTNRQCRQL